MSRQIPSRKWSKVTSQTAQVIRDELVRQGGLVQNSRSPYEVWRVRFSDSTFTYYTSGALYATGSDDTSVATMWEEIDRLVGPTFAPSTRANLLGLDEAGKGEVLGHLVLAAVLIPGTLADRLTPIVSGAETKRRRPFTYWEDIFHQIDQFRSEGLEYAVEKIPPWHVDRYNLNKLLDVTYQRMLNNMFRHVRQDSIRLVLDNYGFGPSLSRFFRAMENIGAEVRVESRADDRYLEARIASIIAKRERERVMHVVASAKKWRVDSLSPGSGNAGDPKTQAWLAAWKATGERWPWFVKRSFKTVRALDGFKDPARKIAPPIRDELLSDESRTLFSKGRFSIRGLSIICPHCGEAVRSAIVTLESEQTIARCPSCRSTLPDLGFTLLYYCGRILPDTNIVLGGLLSKDLAHRQRFFESFRVMLHAVVRAESDSPGGKRELARLAEWADKGRISLDYVGRGRSGGSLERDDEVLQGAIDNDAILVTGDGNLRAVANSKQVFVLATR